MSAAVVVAVAFTLSIVVLATVAGIGVVAGAYVWWKTRALRRQLRENPPGGRIIEGEVIRESARRDD
ncbi:MAG TPA: hypothetical protein VHB46_03795 [Burkholderiales bacterium]|nr:hypothetical protein [Burkholderiales bacterium]